MGLVHHDRHQELKKGPPLGGPFFAAAAQEGVEPPRSVLAKHLLCPLSYWACAECNWYTSDRRHKVIPDSSPSDTAHPPLPVRASVPSGQRRRGNISPTAPIRKLSL